MKSEEKAEMMEMLEGYRDRRKFLYDKGGEEFSKRRNGRSHRRVQRHKLYPFQKRRRLIPILMLKQILTLKWILPQKRKPLLILIPKLPQKRKNPEENPDEEADISRRG